MPGTPMTSPLVPLFSSADPRFARRGATAAFVGLGIELALLAALGLASL